MNTTAVNWKEVRVDRIPSQLHGTEKNLPLSLIVLNTSECLVLVCGWGNWEILSVAVSDRQRRFGFCTQQLMTQPDMCEHWLMTDASNCKQTLRMPFPFIVDNHFVLFHLSLSCGSSCVLFYFISISKSLEEKVEHRTHWKIPACVQK